MFKLITRNLLRHPVRSVLTMGSLLVAFFLLCFLRSAVTTLEAGVEAADSKRLWVQSAVSLFVDLPLAYQPKIEAVDGVARTCKWQWFGGYFREPENFFAQFACDPPRLLEMWPEMKIADGSAEAFLSQRTSGVIGRALADKYGWNVGDRIPITGALFPRPGGEPWVFDVAAIYEPTKATLDSTTMFFHWDYFYESVEAIEGEPPQVGVFVLEVAAGADPTSIMGQVDALFENGPQRVQTTTEAEFSRQFVSMVGNVPRLVALIGGGVFVAILLAVVNTMLMAAREQTRDVGILKSMGFTDGAVFRYFLVQSLFLCVVGGGLGIAFALLSQTAFGAAMGMFFPGYAVLPSTAAIAAGLAVAMGLLAGLVPAREAARLRTVDVLRAIE